jgi:hypothetical protein
MWGLLMYSIFHGQMKRGVSARTVKYRTGINASRLGFDSVQQNLYAPYAVPHGALLNVQYLISLKQKI